MNLHRSILLAAGLSFAACASTSNPNSTGSAMETSTMLTVHVVEASGGA